MKQTNYSGISTDALKEKEEILEEEKEVIKTTFAKDSEEEKEDDTVDEEEEVKSKVGFVLKDCNFRSTPERENTKNVIGQLSEGTQVAVLEITEEWLLICTETGVEGFVLIQLVEF